MPCVSSDANPKNAASLGILFWTPAFDMNLVDLLAGIGKLDAVVWRQRSADGGDVVRIGRRTAAGLLVLESPKVGDGWTESGVVWEVEEFLKAFEPVR